MTDDPDGYGTDRVPGGWVSPDPQNDAGYWRQRALTAERERDELQEIVLELRRARDDG